LQIASADIGYTYANITISASSTLLNSSVEKVELYDGESLISSLPSSASYTFSSLTPLKIYTLRVYYRYDMGDSINCGTAYTDLTFGTQSPDLLVSNGCITGSGPSQSPVLYLNMPIRSNGNHTVFGANHELTTVYMLDGVEPTAICPYAFSGCTKLKNVVLPKTATAIYSNAFLGCTSLKSIVIPENITIIASNAFSNTGIKYIYIHEKLDDLRPNAFDSDCIILYEGAVPNENWIEGWNTYNTVIYNVERVENVGGIAYAVLKDGSKVSLGVDYVEPCTDIPEIEITSQPNLSLENIIYGDKTLSFDCVLSNNNTNSAQIQKIELYFGSRLIKTVYGNESHYTISLPEDAIYTAKLYISYVPEGWGSEDVQELVVTKECIEQSKGLAIKDGWIVGIGTCTDTVLYLNMPIKSGAFRNNKNITAVYMGSGVSYAKIPPASSYYDYYDHGLETGAFQGCTNLEKVVLPNTITAIFSNTFQGCTALETITIPENVLCIMSGAFAGTSIKYVYIHAALDDLIANAFDSDCIILCELDEPHSHWRPNWNTYQYVFFGIAGVEVEGDITYIIFKDGSKTELSY
jgi:hypothetical protein